MIIDKKLKLGVIAPTYNRNIRVLRQEDCIILTAVASSKLT